MLPELGDAGRVFVEVEAGRDLPAPQLRVHASAFAGFLLFYGLENLVAWSRVRAEGADAGGEASRPVMLPHIGGFAAYAWLVSYLMVRSLTSRMKTRLAIGKEPRMPQTKKPNILVLWGDDIGWWNISFNSRGQMGYRTPSIDRLRNEGVSCSSPWLRRVLREPVSPQRRGRA